MSRQSSGMFRQGNRYGDGYFDNEDEQFLGDIGWVSETDEEAYAGEEVDALQTDIGIPRFVYESSSEAEHTGGLHEKDGFEEDEVQSQRNDGVLDSDGHDRVVGIICVICRDITIDGGSHRPWYALRTPLIYIFIYIYLEFISFMFILGFNVVRIMLLQIIQLHAVWPHFRIQLHQ